MLSRTRKLTKEPVNCGWYCNQRELLRNRVNQPKGIEKCLITKLRRGTINIDKISVIGCDCELSERW